MRNYLANHVRSSYVLAAMAVMSAHPAFGVEPIVAPGPWYDPQPAALVASAEDFNGIISLTGCSGSIVRFTSSAGSDQALALTNGHCYETGPLAVGQVLVDKPAYREFKLLRADGSRTLALVKAERLLYASMTGTDVALYRLKLTYDELAERYATTALTIAPQQAPAGTRIRLISGLWKKVYTCSIDGYVPMLREGPWTFKNALRFSDDGCDIIPGTSGSPLIDASSGEVVGINNTRNRSGESCTENNPCEVDRRGTITVRQGQGYGEPLDLFYSCLTADNSLDLNRAGCALAKP